MSVIHITANGDTGQLLQLVRSAIDGEIAKLELGLELARKRLFPFEQKYGVSSGHFAAEMTAEDLTGGDDEYVRWAGEYLLMERLQTKLQRLQEVEYSDAALLQSNQIPG
ncbi:MAG: hypothetical protein KJZ86_27415 [Caldilineaceae bacterium]|nr:hypothetical protein [Caldilineaceae bacterium]HRJ42908.1 hypothetical protein [Caldilineaceae bacterium]